MQATIERGFADQVASSQSVFRAVMAALSRPGLAVAFVPGVQPPRPLTPELAALALALADHEAPVWLDEGLAASPAVAAFLRFHTGARIVADPGDAAFALTVDPAGLLPFARFALGSDDYPDRSTTIVAAVDTLAGEPVLHLRGPGIPGRQTLSASPLPADLPARLAQNRALFPRGVDLLLVASGAVVAVPRSSIVAGED